MSDETPQKGWDSWFATPGSPQDGQDAARQSGPEPAGAQSARSRPPEWAPQPDPAQATQVVPPREASPAQPADRPEAPSPAHGQSPAEQTHWTVPSLGAVLEGKDPHATQVVPPREAAPTSAPASVSSSAPTSGRRPRGYAAAGDDPDQAATQYAPQPPAQSQSQPPEQPRTPAPYRPEPDSGPQAPTAATPAWQTPQPAQMWSSSPTPAGFARRQDAAAQPYQSGNGQSAGAQSGNGQNSDQSDEWADWDEPERRRSTPPPAVGGPSAGTGGDDGRPRGSRKKLAVVGGVGAAGIIALATILLLNQSGSSGAGAAAAKPSGYQPTATTVAGEAQETAAAFLSAWQSGNFQQAANYTDDPSAALSALTSYRDGLNLAGLQLTAQNVTANSASSSSGATASSSGAPAATASGLVTFGVAANVGLPAATSTSASSSASASTSAKSPAGSASAAAGSAAANVTAKWSYTSKLTAYQKNGGWWIKWDPSLVAPNMTAGEKIVSVAIPPTASEVTYATGGDLSAATDPGVKNIAAALKKAAPTGQGTPGVQIELEGADGKPVAGTSDVLSQPVNTGVVKTTINPTVEAAAQAAVQKYADSSMVVIKPSTGEILAVANNDGQNDFALTARVAPGSTNKIITSTALLTSNLVTSPSQAVECPKTITVNGTTFANSDGESTPPTTPFLDDFALSCNNAFGQWYSKIGSTTLAQTAQKYYGLNEQWDIGLGPAGPYYQIPSSSSNGELFQELFGQGQLEASPLAMASVAATVDTGSFKQPIVVPGATQLSATPLPTAVHQDLWQMMKAVTTQSDGTAYGVYSGISSTVYGKTGTADVGEGASKQQKPNSWMVVFDPTLDLAIGCVVLNAGYGASFAGPETAAVLKALQ